MGDRSIIPFFSANREANEFLPKLASGLDAFLAPPSVRILEALLSLRNYRVEVIEADPLHWVILSTVEEPAIED
jgi:hypothetical protein